MSHEHTKVCTTLLSWNGPSLAYLFSAVAISYCHFFHIWSRISGSLAQRSSIAKDDLELFENFYYVIIFKKYSCHSTTMEVRGQCQEPVLPFHHVHSKVELGSSGLANRCLHIKTARWPKFELLVPLLPLPKCRDDRWVLPYPPVMASFS